MRIVKAAEISPAELEGFVSGGKTQGESFYDKMCAEGLSLPELSLAALGEDGGICGYIACCGASFMGERAAFIGALYAANEADAATLVSEAEKRAEELGYSLIAMYDESDFPKRLCGFEYCSAAGIFPPVLSGKWVMWVKRLSGEDGKIGFLELPWASVPAPDFEFDSRFTEEESRDAIYGTRLRQRVCESIALGVIIAAWLVLMIWKRSFAGIGVAAASAYLMVANLVKPKKLTEKYVAEKREKCGTSADDDRIICFPEVFLVYDRIRRHCSSFSYSDRQFIYLKKDYLFVCGFNMTGTFMSYRDMPDKDRFIAYLREKCKGVRVRK